MSTLTTVNSVLALSIASLYPVPQALSGYSVDDSFMAEDIVLAEILMGVDGKMSGGYTPNPVPIVVMLQADSPSNVIFDDWAAATKAASEIYIASGVIVLQGTGQKYALNRGILTSLTPLPASKKILQPRKYTITFESITRSPI
jgi:hypothetical protein